MKIRAVVIHLQDNNILIVKPHKIDALYTFNGHVYIVINGKEFIGVDSMKTIQEDIEKCP